MGGESSGGAEMMRVGREAWEKRRGVDGREAKGSVHDGAGVSMTGYRLGKALGQRLTIIVLEQTATLLGFGLLALLVKHLLLPF